MKRKTYLIVLSVLCIFSLLSTIQISAQGNDILKTIDSLESSLPTITEDSILIETYAELYRYYRRSDLAKAKKYLDLELAITEKIGDNEKIYAAKNRLAIYHSINRELDKADVIFEELLEHYRKTGNKNRESSILTNLSNSYMEKGELKMALEMQFDALKIEEELGVKGIALGKTYFTIANILRLNEEPSVAIEWLDKALTEYRSEDAKEFEAQTVYIKGLSYLSLDSIGLACPLMEEAMSYFRSVQNIPAMSTVLRGLGNCAEERKDYDEALKLYTESLDISKKVGDNRREIECLSKLGEIHLIRKEYEVAVPYLEKSRQLMEEKNISVYKVKLLNILGNALYKSGRIDEAYNVKLEYIAENDSMQIENNKAAISELEIKYQTEKKEQEIILLEERNKLQSIQKKAMTGGIAGLLALLASLFYASRQKLNRNKIEKEKVDQALKFSQRELEIQNKELTAYALQLAHKNEILEGIKDEVKIIHNNSNESNDLQKVLNTIDINQNDEDSWNLFRARFIAVHSNFETTVKEKFPEVTYNEMRLMSLLKMNLNSKEIANILNISNEGVKKARYRLRKKLGLEPSDSLEDLVIQL